MDGFIHAALEAEGILNRAKHVSKSVSQIDNYTSDDKMTWKMRLTDSLDESRIKFQRNPGGSNAPKANEKFDLFKKLHELYDELSMDESLQINYQGLKTTSYLLEKLLSKYRLNSLIINLYPGNKGYSLSLKVNGSTQHNYPPETDVTSNQDETMIETPRWPYEEEDLLSYIDNEELPVMLLDLLEAEHSCLFYSGCIIAQIRDYRQAYPSSLCDTHHVLLRPTNQSILTDAMAIGGRNGWASEERGSLEAVEAALVHASAPPLCLDPRPAVGLLAARLHAAPRLFNTPRIRRQARRFSQVAVNRKRKLDQFTHHHGIELLDAIQKQRTKNVLNPNAKVQQPKFPGKPPEVFKAIEAPKMECPSLATPSDEFSPLRSARAYERSRPMYDCYPHLVEEYVLETEKTSPHAGAGAGCFHIKLSILQRPSDQEFLGELYVDRDHVEGERNGAACRFALGSRLQANKYIQQFTVIFTEEGRKSVRIKHIVPGHAPRVSYTGGMRELNQQLLLQQRAAAAAAAAAAASGATVQTHATTVPVVTPAIAQTPNTHTNIRQLPILQAQLQQVGGVGGVGGVSVVGVAAGVAADAALKQQPSPTTPRLSPQVHDVHSTPSSSNQLLTQQLSNPPQPINPPPPQINPQKMPSAIIHIQHPLMSSAGTSQVQNIQYTTTTTTQQKPTINKQRTTNPAIDALVTSLMNSAQQFQQAASQNAAKSAVSTAGGSAGGGGGTAGSNSTILNLLNSAPAAMTHGHGHAHALGHALGHGHGGAGGEHEHKLVARAVSIAGARLVTAAPAVSHTVPAYTQQVMSGYTCDSKPASVASGDSALLERLMGPDQSGSASAAAGPSPAQPAPAAQAPPVCHLQGLSLASLQGLQGLQNVQVQIPGLAAPISLSLNVSGAPGGLLVSVPPTTSVVLANQPSVLSLPIAQLMPGGVKGAVRGGTVQVVRGRAPARAAPAAHAQPLHALHTAAGAAPATATTVTAAPGVAGVNTKRIIRVQHAGDTKHFTGTAQFITQAQAQALSAQHVRRKSNPDSS